MNLPAAADRRKRFQFRLKTLFVLMTIVALWLGFVMDKARKLRRSVSAITEAGGMVIFRHQKNSLNAPPPGPAWLRSLMGDELFITPTYAKLAGPEVTDRFLLENLTAMPSLEDLDIDSPNVTDAGLTCLSSLAALKYLGLTCPSVGDEAMEHVGTRRELEVLTLECPRVTDAALPHLAVLPKLKSLVLNTPLLSAEGLQQLKALKNLQFVRSLRDPGNMRVVKHLQIPSEAQFTDVPLIDVVDYLVDYHGDSPRINRDDLPRAKWPTPITLTLKGELQCILDAILPPCELDYYIDQGIVKIAPRQIAQEHRQAYRTLRSIVPQGKIETDW